MIDENLTFELLDHYRYLHEHPELSFCEHMTSNYIRQVLDRNGIEHYAAGKTGILGFIPSPSSRRTIALRADMDALPIEEDPAHTIKSAHPGIMHSCGHDLHTACLLGAAEYLQNHRDQLPVNILLIFQHAEEVLPGGALDILKNETYLTHKPEWIIALHAEPELATGTFGICSGPYMASGDEIYITLRGPGGHAAFPDKSPDLVLIASHIIIALQQIVSRNASPFIPSVLTFGNIRCHSAMNIIPSEIILEGTFRTFDETWREKAKHRIRQVALSIAEGMSAQAEVSFTEGYPVLYNDPAKAAYATKILENMCHPSKVVKLPQRMTTEDFARYSRQTPATFIRLGVQGPHLSGKLHTPQFCIDPAALRYGTRALCALALSPESSANCKL